MTDLDLSKLREIAERSASWRDSQQSVWLTPGPPTAKTLLALLDRLTDAERRLEFLETLADGGGIKVNGEPWRLAYERLLEIVGD